MSGGVDSSVSALLLKEQGYDVIGLFMKNWEEKDESGVCTSAKEYDDVVRVCDTLKIPHYTVNFTQEYWDLVFTQFLQELKMGFTPNPDILCNREIKFNLFFKKALELGADALAMGHYAQTCDNLLLRSHDTEKDQTYFLYTLKSEILKKTLFPIGHLTKTDVRKLAKDHNLATAEKKDSTGICFIGERNFAKFISTYIPYQEGPFQKLSGQVVGKHLGVAYYTIGQRKGLSLGGPGEPWFVVGKDVKNNIVFVEQGDDHPALYSLSLTASDATWIDSTPTFPLHCTAKIRYRQPDQPCIVEQRGQELSVQFLTPQRAITPSQSVVFYQGALCLGGATIN
jgi:tRNA-specific 2-thiouridylase